MTIGPDCKRSGFLPPIKVLTMRRKPRNQSDFMTSFEVLDLNPAKIARAQRIQRKQSRKGAR